MFHLLSPLLLYSPEKLAKVENQVQRDPSKKKYIHIYLIENFIPMESCLYKIIPPSAFTYLKRIRTYLYRCNFWRQQNILWKIGVFQSNIVISRNSIYEPVNWFMSYRYCLLCLLFWRWLYRRYFAGYLRKKKLWVLVQSCCLY